MTLIHFTLLLVTLKSAENLDMKKEVLIIIIITGQGSYNIS